VNILHYSCLEEKDKHRLKWIKGCVRDLEQDVLVCDTLLHLKQILKEYGSDRAEYRGEPPAVGDERRVALRKLDETLGIRRKIVASLVRYMARARPVFAAGANVDAATVNVEPDHSHNASIKTRLDFLTYYIQATWLEVEYEGAANLVWETLIDHGACPSDREAGFGWFTLTDTPGNCVTVGAIEDLFVEKVLRLPAATLSDGGYRCFESFFKCVNVAGGALTLDAGGIVVQDNALKGIDELYRFALECPHNAVGSNAIAMIKTLFTTLSDAMNADRLANDGHLIREILARIAEASPSIEVDAASALCVERSLTLLRDFTTVTDAA
jgi:hypothetical protein